MMRSALFRLTTGCFAATLLTVAAHALPEDQNQPVNLSADRATYNERTGVTTYTGNVVITQGTARIAADSVVMNLDPVTRSIRTATAKGHPAKFQQRIDPAKGIAYSEGDQIVYDAKTGIVTMTGNARIDQDGSSFRGYVLRYSMTKGDIEARGGGSDGRVYLTIPPNSGFSPQALKGSKGK